LWKFGQNILRNPQNLPAPTAMVHWQTNYWWTEYFWERSWNKYAAGCWAKRI